MKDIFKKKKNAESTAKKKASPLQKKKILPPKIQVHPAKIIQM